MTKEIAEFLLEVLRTKGIAFPLEKCEIANRAEKVLEGIAGK